MNSDIIKKSKDEYRKALEDLRGPIKIVKPRRIVKWLAIDGKSFWSVKILRAYEENLRAARYSEAMKKRNWFQKLFNIKLDPRLC